MNNKNTYKNKKKGITFIFGYLKKFKKSFVIIIVLSLFVAVVQAVPTKMTEQFSTFFSPNVFNLLASILEFFFISAILISINWVMYCILLVPVPLMFIVIRLGMKKLLMKTEAVMEHSSKQTSLVNERHNSDENMMIGENGIKLSGGEIQKIAITRALLSNALIIL